METTLSGLCVLSGASRAKEAFRRLKQATETKNYQSSGPQRIAFLASQNLWGHTQCPRLFALVTFVIFNSSQQTCGLRQASPCLFWMFVRCLSKSFSFSPIPTGLVRMAPMALCRGRFDLSYCTLTRKLESPKVRLAENGTIGAQMAFERRLEAVVLGPGRPGHVKVALDRGQHQFVTDVPFELLRHSLRMPNSEFVAVVNGRELVRIEPAGRIWLTIQDQIRAVLNSDWDPIGVADVVDDEYDMYIGQIHSLLAKDSSEQAIADHLLRIELKRMGLTGTHEPTAPSGGKSTKSSTTASRESWLAGEEINQDS
jgi:hypothetical protein